MCPLGSRVSTTRTPYVRLLRLSVGLETQFTSASFALAPECFLFTDTGAVVVRWPRSSRNRHCPFRSRVTENSSSSFALLALKFMTTPRSTNNYIDSCRLLCFYFTVKNKFLHEKSSMRQSRYIDSFVQSEKCERRAMFVSQHSSTEDDHHRYEPPTPSDKYHKSR